MKRVLFLLALVAVLGLGIVWSGFAQTASSINWLTDYNSAVQESKNTNKPVMMYFYTSSCSWCKKLETDTWSDTSVIAKSSSFVCVKLSSGPAVSKYSVSGVPHVIFIDPSENILTDQLGYVGPTSMLSTMDTALSSYGVASTPTPTPTVEITPTATPSPTATPTTTVPENNASVSIQLAKTCYVGEDTQDLNITVQGSGTADIYVALLYGDGSFSCMTPPADLGQKQYVLPYVNNWNITSGNYQLKCPMSMIPTGSYSWYIILCRPGTTPLVASNWITSAKVDFSIDSTCH